jgi:hypothetical protein
VGTQDDALLFSATKDATWAALGGFTDWADATAYKAFKVRGAGWGGGRGVMAG